MRQRGEEENSGMTQDPPSKGQESVWKIILRGSAEWGMLVAGGVALAFIVERMSGAPLGAYLNLFISN